MTLNDYLAKYNLTDGEFAALIERDRTTVLRWRRRLSRPVWADFAAIMEATEGLVTPNDFLHEFNIPVPPRAYSTGTSNPRQTPPSAA